MSLMALGLSRLHESWWADGGARFALAGAITLVFAGLGYVVHGVNRSGAIAGGVICLALFTAVGPAAFVALLALFVVTWIATRVGRSRKQRLGTAERGDGRNASQVFANVGAAGICALLYGLRGDSWLLLACAAAMAEAAADTVSSELGQAFSRRALLITSLETVPPGTDGGISIRGTAAGVLAACVVSAVCVAAGMIPARWASMAALAGVCGMVIDSLLGACFERAGRVGNDAVNFASTVAAALLGGVGASLVS
jgi:uncharacterized protein (TIGR00297 family)